MEIEDTQLDNIDEMGFRKTLFVKILIQLMFDMF